jgi:glycosyltransferase involved in cell wall biosynthesis
MNTDVTVVVTCFEYGEFLEEAVQSALAQEGGPPRVVVVDDGSTDPATLEALDRLPPEVHVHRQANAGLSAARNAGFRLTDTPYAIALDADDRLMPGALRALRAPLEADERLGFAYGRTRFFGDLDTEMTMPPYDPYKLLYRHMIGSTALMRRELFDDVGGFDPEFRGYEDWEFWLHALARGWRGRRVDEVTFEYRRHGGTMNAGARREYRSWYRKLRRKHASLYARRSEFARESDLGPFGRAVYRWWWGPRPLPATVELALQAWWFRLAQRREERTRR